jgi:uncharacterized repeat protein (TIGR01451 family)
LDKRVTALADVNGNGFTDAGDTISWSFDVTNTGTQTVNGVTIVDPVLTARGITVTCPTTTLGPSESVTCTADEAYVITQAEVDTGDGTITNIAIVTVDNPVGVFGRPADRTDTPVTQVSALTLDKQVTAVDDVNGNSLTDAGDTITWRFDVTNTGTQTITDVTVEDDLLAARAIAVSCPTGGLAPGAEVTCNADRPYVISQAEVDDPAGAITNSATAAGEDPVGGPVANAVVVSPEDTTATPLDQVATMTLDKEVAEIDDTNANGSTDAGDKITWEFDVSNTGTTTLEDLSIADGMLDDAGISVSCPPEPVPPGDSVVCTQDTAYGVTDADAERGEITNTATASASNAVAEAVASNEATTVTAVVDSSDTPTTTVPQEPPPAAGGQPPAGEDLATTGGNTRWSLLLGFALLLMGAALIINTRRAMGVGRQ